MRIFHLHSKRPRSAKNVLAVRIADRGPPFEYPCSTERLRLLLLKSGYAEEVVLAWSREQLMSKYAELLAQGWHPAVGTRPVDPELEKMRLAHEMEMKRM